MKIDFASMNKEQKQLVFLGMIVGAAALYAAIAFGVMPTIAKWNSAKSELADLEQKLDTADRLVRRTQALRGELAMNQEKLQQAAQEYLPETENTLAWVTRRIYQKGRDFGVDVEAVVPSSSGLQLATIDRTKGTYDRKFDLYGVRITTNCGFAKALEFVGALEESNPYLVVSGIVMAVNPQDPSRHSVQIEVQWPLWVNAEGANQIRTLEGTPHG